MSKWLPEHITYLQAHYQTKGNIEIAPQINKTPGAIKKYMQQLGIKRTPEQLKEIRSRLSKRTNSSHFKKGNIPHNANYNGHERITKDGYVEVRIRSGKYRLKHLVNWEAQNGPLPKGHCITFLDGNKQNCKLSNLKLITRIENMLRNSKHQHPKQVIPTMVLISKLNNKIKTIQDGTK